MFYDFVSVLRSMIRLFLCNNALAIILQTFITDERRDLQLVDAPVSGGVVKAGNGKLTVSVVTVFSILIWLKYKYCL